jgi:hypothetical protein
MAEPKNIGALWAKTNDKGSYLIGNVEVDGKKVEIVCYPSGFANGIKPDYIIELSNKQG